jgi:hypothetical protein
MTVCYVLDCERVSDDEGGALEVDDATDAGVDLAAWSSGHGHPLAHLENALRTAFALAAVVAP